MGETQAPDTPDVADPIVVGSEAPDVADPIVVRTLVHQQEDPDERRLQIMKGDVTLKVTIMAGRRISRDTLENLEDDVRVIFKRARRELQTVGEQVLAVGEQIQIEVDGHYDHNIVRVVNCGVENNLWSASVV